jgi:hypothetical protein
LERSIVCCGRKSCGKRVMENNPEHEKSKGLTLQCGVVVRMEFPEAKGFTILETGVIMI